MTTSHLTRDQIAAQFKLGKKPFVIRHMDGRYFDLHLDGISRLDEGTYAVDEMAHEIVVHDRRKRE